VARLGESDWCDGGDAVSPALAVSPFAHQQHVQVPHVLDMHALVSVTDSDGVIIDVNDRFCAASGFAQEELLGRNFQTFISGEHPTLYRQIRDKVAAGESWHGEICIRKKDGNPLWLNCAILSYEGDPEQGHRILSVGTDISHLKWAVQRLQSGLEKANIGNWDRDLETGEMFWTPNVSELFGHPYGSLEANYDNLLTAIHPDDREMVLAAVRNCISRGEALYIEHRCIWPDGTVRWILAKADVVRDDTGKPRRLMGAIQDITRRRALQEKLKSFKDIVDSVVSGVVVIDARGCIIEINPAMQQIFGYAQEELLGANVRMLMPEAHGKHHDGYLRRYAETGQEKIIGRSLEMPGLRKDGSVFPLEITVTEIRIGEEAHFVGVLRDITERKDAQRILEKERGLLRQAQEIARLGNWEIASNDGSIYWSPVVYEIFGKDPRTFRPTIENFYEMVHPDDLEALKRHIARARETGTYDMVHRIVLPDGSVRHVHERARFEPAPDGTALFAVGIVQDVTNMVRAKEQAEAASRAKSEFLSSMSHELRTPLNAVMGFAQVLEIDEGLTEDQLDSVRTIRKSGQHLLQLINEILDLARIESGRLELSIEDVGLAELFAESGSLVTPLAAGRDVAVQFARKPSAIAVRGDRTRLNQVLVNLLSNAVKYNRRSGSVVVTALPGGDGMIRIAVADTGAGIPAEKLDQLFTPFNRLGAENTEIEGTGIGLVIAKRLIEGMGGRIGVESRAGAGSTFWFELPGAKLAAAQPAAAQSLEESPRRQWALPEGTVLYVEDNPANLKLVRQALVRHPQVTLLEAYSGSLGLDLAQVHLPDVILLDINMPGMNGLEVLVRLKADPATRDIPVLALSAAAMEKDVQRGRGAGFEEYLTKPIDINSLLETLGRWLGKKESAS
jgi:PAS domain S-box-containing protein